MPFPSDGHLLPGHGQAEKPQKRTRLAETLEGAQIAVLEIDPGPGPTGSPVLGIETTAGARLVIMAARDRNSRYAARLVFRLMPPKILWSPDDERRSRFGRPAEERDPDPVLAGLQRRVEGEIIRGLIQTDEPTSFGGECLAIELSNGARLSLAAAPAEGVGRDGQRLFADLVWAYSERQRSRIVMP